MYSLEPPGILRNTVIMQQQKLLVHQFRSINIEYIYRSLHYHYIIMASDKMITMLFTVQNVFYYEECMSPFRLLALSAVYYTKTDESY